jgi:hypothetical protein
MQKQKMLRLRTTFRAVSAICPKMGSLSIQTQKNHALKFGKQQKIAVSLQCQKTTTTENNNSINNKNLKTMTTKNFNAKKVLMSTVAAVVFSFVFTTSANANSPENSQKANLEVRVKGSANDDKNNVGIRVKGTANDGKNNVGIRVKGSQQNTEDDSNFVTILLQTFGVRVK